MMGPAIKEQHHLGLQLLPGPLLVFRADFRIDHNM